VNRLVVLACTLTAGLGLAEQNAPQGPIGQTWSIVGARTVEPGANVFEAAAGFPGLAVSYLRGVAPGLNLGGRLSFVYGIEGLVREIIPGVKLQGLLKLRLLDSERVSLGVTFEPGPFFHAPYGAVTRAGFALPVGLRLGIATSSAVSLALQVEVPLWIEFGPTGGFNVPILSGVGIEYFLTSNVGVFFRARLGPTLRPSRLAELTFDGLLGVGFRL
jgi:hypothetical protein